MSSPPNVPPQNKLNRTLTFSDVFAYGLLYFVPMAPIPVFGIIYNISGGMVALTYIIAAITMIFSAIISSEMARQIPLAGSVYSYVSKGANPFFGFVAGWAILLDYLLLPALLAILGAGALLALFPDINKLVWIAAFVAIPMLVNLLGIQMNAKIGKILLGAQLAVLSLFAFFAIKFALENGVTTEALIAPLYNPKLFTLSLAFAAVPIASLSFIGFDAVSTLNEEAIGGGKTVSKVTMLLLFAVTGLFVLQVYLAAIFVLPGTVFPEAEAEAVFYTISVMLAGDWFLPVITLTNAILAILANALVSQATTSKVLFSMARDGRLPAVLGILNKRSAPRNAIFAVAVLSFIIASVSLNQVELVVTLVTFGALTAYLMLHVAVLMFFNKHPQKNMLKHCASPVFGIIILGYALWNANVHAKQLGALWLLLGLLIAFFMKRQNKLQNINLDL